MPDTLATSMMAPDAEGMPDGPPDPAMLARYPSMDPKTGQFGPLQRRPAPPPPSRPDPSDPRWQAHREALAVKAREEQRLLNRYPSLANQTRQMEPVPGHDPASFEGRFYKASMPDGSADPRPAAAKPAVSPPTQPAPLPVTKPVASGETATGTAPDTAPAAFPPDYAGLTLPPGVEAGEGFTAAAAKMHEAGLSKAQAEQMLQLYSTVQQQEDQHLAAIDASWRAEAERTVPASDLAAAKALMKTAPPEVARTLEASRLGNHAPTLKWLARLSRGGR
jgi:hypothetical protein